MKKLKILTDPDETYTKVMWHCHIEIGGDRFVILGEEDNNGAEYNIYCYDENCRDGIGEEYDGEDHDSLYEELSQSDFLSRDGLTKDSEFELTYDEE